MSTLHTRDLFTANLLTKGTFGRGKEVFEKAIFEGNCVEVVAKRVQQPHCATRIADRLDHKVCACWHLSLTVGDDSVLLLLTELFILRHHITTQRTTHKANMSGQGQKSLALSHSFGHGKQKYNGFARLRDHHEQFVVKTIHIGKGPGGRYAHRSHIL